MESAPRIDPLNLLRILLYSAFGKNAELGIFSVSCADPYSSSYNRESKVRFAASHWLDIVVRSGEAISPISRLSAKMHYGVERNSVTSLVPAVI